MALYIPQKNKTITTMKPANIGKSATMSPEAKRNSGVVKPINIFFIFPTLHALVCPPS